MPLRLAGGLAAIIAASIALGLTSPLGGDYARPECKEAFCDDAAPPIRAIVDLDFGRLVEVQGLIGPVSLVMRAPFAAIAYKGDGSEELAYGLGVIPCMLVVGLFGLWLASLMAARGKPLWAQALVIALMMFSPIVFSAREIGHPEEMVAGALGAAGVIAAMLARPVAAGTLLGLAIATKLSAGLALPIALAAGRRPVPVAVIACGLAAALTLPMALGDMDRFRAGLEAVTDLDNGARPTNVWWPLAEPYGEVRTAFGTRTLYRAPEWVNVLSHYLLLAVAVGLAAAWAAARGKARAEGALVVLTLVMLLRPLLDPITLGYYHVPLLISAAATDALDPRRRVPWVTIYIAAATGVTRYGGTRWEPDVLNQVYMAWALPLLAWLALAAFAPRLLPTSRARETSG